MFVYGMCRLTPYKNKIKVISRLFNMRYSSESKRTIIFPRTEVSIESIPIENIRNFSIIAHVDHGKSTLADRLLEMTGTISADVRNAQVLDKLPVERERGITVKAQTASLFYEYKGNTYLLNLIDTPGHVDFNYEVSRSLSACQGVILLVDANQGVQAQTVANFYLAFDADLMIIPAMNKVDLKNADPDAVAKQMQAAFEFSPYDILRVSAKFGTGVRDLLSHIIEKIPAPLGNRQKPLRALIFDSWHDRYRGVIAHIAITDGSVHVGDDITLAHTNKTYQVKEVGILHPDETPTSHLFAGQVGYIAANMRDIKDVRVGDTCFLKSQPVPHFPGFRAAKPMVFAGIYPMDQSQYVSMRSAIEKLTLNDSSVSLESESSPALGQGWRLGFLGLLHMDVFCQRLDQEYDAQVIITAPNVPYKAKIQGAKNVQRYGVDEIVINNPMLFPDKTVATEYLEPMVLGTIITPQVYVGKIIGVCVERRGVQLDARNLDEKTITLKFKLPLNEIIVDFFDELKSLSAGYASFDYDECGYQSTDLVKLNILLNGQEVEEFTTIVNTVRVRKIAVDLCNRLKDSLPRQQYAVAIQAAVGGKIIAREDIKALRKDVTAKLYGGDVTRRKKLLARQAEGKKRLRMIGNVEVPRDVFIKVLRKS